MTVFSMLPEAPPHFTLVFYNALEEPLHFMTVFAMNWKGDFRKSDFTVVFTSQNIRICILWTLPILHN